SVKFNHEVYETSFGGTETVTRMRLSLDNNPRTSTPDVVEEEFMDGSLNSENDAAISDLTVVARVEDDSALFASETETEEEEIEFALPAPPAPALKPSRIKIPPAFCSLSTSKLPSSTEAPSTPVSKIRKSYPDFCSSVASTPDCFTAVQMGTPLPKSKKRRSNATIDTAELGEDRCSVTVAVRVRPFSKRELERSDVRNVVSMTNNETCVMADTGVKYRFLYDFSFWSFDEKKGNSYAGQEYVYNTVAEPQLAKAFEGYNTCLFAYGQTGSGKSYCITGHGDDRGIIPRFGDDLFRRRDLKVDAERMKINVEISFFEIYNEKIHDLLAPSGDNTCANKQGSKHVLRVREHPVLGPYVEGLSSYVVSSFEDMQTWLNLGNKQRATAATGMNDKSSRSHSVFTIILTQTRSENIEGEDHEHSTTSKINLIDLAGSERQSTAKTSGDRLKEGASINKSLLTLGKVISTLSDLATCTNRKRLFIPYRDSILTWLLKESLGGNSQTAMLATISPANICMEETLSTLRYAKQARAIVNNAKVNEDPKARLIRELRAEIEKLRGQTGGLLSTGNEYHLSSSLAEIASLKDKLLQKEKEMMEATRTWQEKLKASEKRRLEEEKLLEKSGIALKIDNRQPYLVNLNEDPLLSETLLYILKEGQTRVGRRTTGSDQEVQLQGALIAEDHCLFDTASDGHVYISPIEDAPTYVNGDAITEKIPLHHGDRVILGGDHYFRFNHPIESQNKHTTSTTSHHQPRDFDYAKRELIKAQNARMQLEIEKMKAEMEKKLLESQQEAEEELTVQRHTYEEKVAQLKEIIKEQSVERDQMDKLEQQNQMLQQQLIALVNKRKLEAKASSQIVTDAKVERSRIMEQLEKQKQKMALDVERLKQQREKSTPVKQKPLTPISNRTDTYRNTLLIREANKISQFLKKHTVFGSEDVDTPESGSQILVKVTNAKLGISTFWTTDKFEDKLVQMRELYNGDGESNDNVFYDPNDTWEKENRLNDDDASPQNTERRLSLIRKSLSPRSPALRRRSSDRRKSSKPDQDQPTSLDLCRELIVNSISNIRVTGLKESMVDHILNSLQMMQSSMQNILDDRKTNSGSIGSKVTDVVQAQSLELTVTLRELVSMTTVWAASISGKSSLMKSYVQQLLETAKKLGNQTVLFLQGCNSDINSMVNESSNQMCELITAIAKQCGETALASDTRITCLTDSRELDSITDDDDTDLTTQVRLTSSLRQATIGGCDLFLDKTLHAGLKTIEEALFQIQSLGDREIADRDVAEVIHRSELLVASTKVLLAKLQEIQIELDTSMTETNRPDNYWDSSYKRCQTLIINVSSLTDHVAIIQQLIHTFLTSEEKDARRLLRSVESVKTATEKLQATSNVDLRTDDDAESSAANTTDTSILSDAQNELLDMVANDVRSSGDSLGAFLTNLIETNARFTSPSKLRQPNSTMKSSNNPCSSNQRRKKTVRPH
ncbi:kinesin-like protein KIF14, partial [Tubulanus polymorphus]|uniref:kinesin-like protein KIF14 n=1 Tax=Tubulanus polymorphus TaxID=672921 RepID=UPI003DA5FAE5